MLIVYDSKTGNVERFVNKLNIYKKKVSSDLIVTEPFVLITFTTGFGRVPQSTLDFLERENHRNLIKGVCASGNRNWADSYAVSADLIANKYDVCWKYKFELSGLESDVLNVIKKIKEIEGGLIE